MPVAHPLEPADPLEIGPFVLLGRLATGGMGIVYLGRRQGDAESLVTVKVPHEDLAADPDFRGRFHAEIAASRLVSAEPGAETVVARLVEADADADRPWLASELVPGLSLHEAAQGQPLPPDRLDALAVELARAVERFHEWGLAHCDLKPANVVLGPDGVRLIDLGLARPLSSAAPELVLGSPGWSPPEQHTRTADVPEAADVHGWGMCVAYAATGEPPYGVGDAALLAERMLTGRPPLDRVPEHLRPSVDAALAISPYARPSAADLLAGLGAGGDVDRSRGSERATRPLDGTGAFPPPTLVEPGGPVGARTLDPGATAPADAPAALSRTRRPAVSALGAAAAVVVGVLLLVGARGVPTDPTDVPGGADVTVAPATAGRATATAAPVVRASPSARTTTVAATRPAPGKAEAKAKGKGKGNGKAGSAGR